MNMKPDEHGVKDSYRRAETVSSDIYTLRRFCTSRGRDDAIRQGLLYALKNGLRTACLSLEESVVSQSIFTSSWKELWVEVSLTKFQVNEIRV